jgi:hypothetical protein
MNIEKVRLKTRFYWMQKALIIAFYLFQATNISGQSRRELISILQSKLDSSAYTLEYERNLFISKYELLNTEIKNYQNQIRLSSLEINRLKDTLSIFTDHNYRLIAVSDSLRNHIDSLASILKSTYKIPENDYEIIKKYILSNNKNVSEIKRWINNNYTSNNIFTKECEEFYKDAIDYNLGYDGLIDEATFKYKWAHRYDVNRSNYTNISENGNCGWAEKILTNIEYIGNLNNGDWLILTIKGSCYYHDFSSTIIRVIKVVSNNNSFLIDNIISLSDG